MVFSEAGRQFEAKNVVLQFRCYGVWLRVDHYAAKASLEAGIKAMDTHSERRKIERAGDKDSYAAGKFTQN